MTKRQLSVDTAQFHTLRLEAPLPRRLTGQTHYRKQLALTDLVCDI